MSTEQQGEVARNVAKNLVVTRRNSIPREPRLEPEQYITNPISPVDDADVAARAAQRAEEEKEPHSVLLDGPSHVRRPSLAGSQAEQELIAKALEVEVQPDSPGVTGLTSKVSNLPHQHENDKQLNAKQTNEVLSHVLERVASVEHNNTQ
eukprot:UN01335